MIYSKGKSYKKNEVPSNVRPFVGYNFNYGTWDREMGPTVEARTFMRKYKNCIKKLLPGDYEIVEWNNNYWEISAVIKDNKDNFIYMSISDLRYRVGDGDEWLTNILIRTMSHRKDWTGGMNHYTDLFNFTKDISRLK